jgi:hypothetical protein
VRYKAYYISEDEESFGKLYAVDAELEEMTCRGCSASWLGLPLTTTECPYCGIANLFEGQGEYGYLEAEDGTKWYTTNLGATWQDLAPTSLLEQSGGASGYARDIRGVVRALWAGTIDYDQASGLLINTIRLGVEKAFHEGAKSVGIAPVDLSPEERIAILNITVQEIGFIPDFLADIQAGSKANGGKLAPLLSRADMWGLRYADVVNRARVMAGGDKKLEWVLGPTKEHCVDCARLAGKVKRASYWQREGIAPQSHDLACGGWRCLCTLEPTDKSCTPGPLPRLVGPEG